MGQARADETERFRDLYARSQDQIFAFSARRTSSFEDAADVFAETFLVAWRKIDQIPDGEASILWLYVTCRQELANQYRKSRRRSELLNEMGAGLEAEFLADQEASMGSALVARELLWRLPEGSREILMLAAWEGLNSSEIGQVLDCSAVAARIRLHRARNQLSDEMRRMDLLRSQETGPDRAVLRETSANRETQGRHEGHG
jgi:RNA polymerase sigma-70 factor (ECF subfamily)